MAGQQAKQLKRLTDGFDAWSRKLEEIAALGLSNEDFYTHLKKEVVELDEGRNDEEMVDVLNCVGMLIYSQGYRVDFQDCLAKLKAREEKYERRRETP
jgi:hypothetical protein